MGIRKIAFAMSWVAALSCVAALGGCAGVPQNVDAYAGQSGGKARVVSAVYVKDPAVKAAAASDGANAARVQHADANTANVHWWLGGR
jgi:hypothetical protein